VSPDVVAHAAADIDQEAMVAGEAGAEVNAIAGVVVSVESGALPADAGHEIEANLFGYVGLVHGVEVGNDGAVGLATSSAVVSGGTSPRGLKVEANALVEDDVGADAGVKAPLLGTACKIGARSTRGQNRAASKHGVRLLGGGKLGQEEDCENGCKKR